MLRIGISGWAYKDWKGDFYPAGLKDRDRLAFYAGQFSTVELNASFYRLPSAAAVANWAAAVLPDFAFAWKVWRGITHDGRLDDLPLVFERMAPLSGPALFQLPPSLKRDDGWLAELLARLPQTRCAIEFRHPGWYAPAVFDLLAQHNRALVISDHHHAPAPSVATADWVYWRGHGPSGRYFGHYSDAAIGRLADEIAAWCEAGRDVYAYFDNTMACAAPHDALKLKGFAFPSSPNDSIDEATPARPKGRAPLFLEHP